MRITVLKITTRIAFDEGFLIKPLELEIR